MARKAIQYYIFTPGAGGAGTVKIADPYQLKDILMITNVTTNQVIYNFSDSTRGGALSYASTDTTTFPGAQNGVTTITLDLDTSAMNANDRLQIFVETVELRIRTHDFGIDAVERQRIGLPESLIDADFEYGLQQTKWASFTAGFQTSMTYEVPGTDVQANIFGYATMMTAGSSGNITATGAGGTAFKLLNQGFTPAVTTTNFPLGFPISYQGNTGPFHNPFDYKIVINQPLGGSHPRGTTWVGNAAVTTGARHVTLANGGPAQKTFTVLSTANWNAGDIGVIVTLPDNDVATVATTAVTAGASALATNVALAVPQAVVLAVETAIGGTFELVGVNAGAGTTALGITRGLLGTNSDSVQNLPVGARIKAITSNVTVGFASNLELFRVDSIDTVTSTFTVTRGWMNTNASPIINPGSICAKVNMASELSTGLGGASNIEILRGTSVSPLQDASQTVVRSGLGTTAITAAPAGSLVVTAAGVFVAGNVNVPVIGINANAHGVPSSVQGAGPHGLSAAVAGVANVGNCFVSTLGLNNANVEGIYFNTINDVNYMAFYPKVSPSRDIGYQLSPPVVSNDVVVRKGGLYSGANIQYASIVSNVGTPSTITVTTVQPHGLYPGMILQTQLFGAQNANTHASGIFAINSVPYSNQFTFVAKPGATVANALAVVAALGTQSQINGNITLFPTSLVRHRPVDGGTNIGVNAPSFGYEVARQTKKYFRYQSGKGMMFTTGISMCPVFTVTNVVAGGTSIGSTVTILTELEHGLQVGANIGLFGITTTGYNDYYLVNSVVNPSAFTVLAKSLLGATTPTYGTFPKFSVLNWHGARVRVGMFDDQNGVYWEYDGINVKVGRRSATREVLGRVNAGINQHLVAGDRFTRFVDQLDVGDQIVIRGQNHTVSRIVGQSEMYITPTYRGSVNAAEARMSVIDTLNVPQSQFNLDRLDGTGPSGYVLDKSKMQMVAIQYTWYGAGFIDWGMRATDGKLIWAHRVKNNNVNDEAFMRSGNLPARYMSSNRTNAIARLALPLVGNETGNISLTSAHADFPQATASQPVSVIVNDEIITYAAGPFTANGNICTLTRSAVISNYNLGQIRSMSMGLNPQGTGASHSETSTCRLFSITASPDLNHWGSAVILDGRFDVDRTYQFTYNLANLNVLGTQVQTLLMMRLAPAITNAVTGELGSKDLINRAQLLLQNMFVNIADTAATLKPRFLLQAVLNPTNIISANWQPLNVRFNQPGGTLQTGGFNQPSFTQFVANVYPATDKPTNLWGVNSVVFDLSPRGHHNGLPYAQGGEQLFSIPLSATNSGFIDLRNVKEIGGAVLPGTGFFPNGNEIVAFNIVPAQGSQANIDIQVTYIESQA
jgi:hypothetical protein